MTPSISLSEKKKEEEIEDKRGGNETKDYCFVNGIKIMKEGYTGVEVEVGVRNFSV